MGAVKNTITINGKVYDTITGKLVGESEGVIIKPTKIDEDDNLFKVEVKVKSSNHKINSNHQKRHKTQRSATLMRSIVKKPIGSKNIRVTNLASQPNKKIIHGHNSQRQTRAAEVLKSRHVSKFINISQPIAVKTQNIPVKRAPVHDDRPVNDEKPEPMRFSNPVAPPISLKRHLPSNIIESALNKADSHQQKSVKKHRSKKFPRVAASAAVVVLLAAFFLLTKTPVV